MKILHIDSKIGGLEIIEESDFITNLSFLRYKELIKNDCTPLLKETKRQIDAYFEGKLKVFDLPLKLDGSDFRIKVLKALQEIPYGEVVSYKDIALKIGNEKASRAVGMANNKNKIPIIIPCHRVIGKSGKLVGYGGGLDIKTYLLNMEQYYLGLQPQ
ncbi:MAG: Methylated-DNA--protein-cysteine methyltransferase, constitutive [Alphaproteobacteria bacterium ADurb.Bin438]|nr:MAG: Methylated-DNA--protein-cysteine methyltransferase, constitutive [Alphaproteobacteria bacterium ADurb.Bin438]